jgi:ligand-binding sensor domain-containing protein
MWKNRLISLFLTLPILLGGFTVQPEAVKSLNGTITNYYDGNNVQDLAFDQQGYLWAATTHGVVRWDIKKKTYTRYTEDDGLPKDDVTAIAAARDGSIWIGGYGYIARLRCGKWTEYKIPELTGGEPRDDIPVKNILENKKGEIWFATYGAGAIRIKDDAVTVFRQKDGIASTALVSVHEDISGNLWFVQYYSHGEVDMVPSRIWHDDNLWKPGISKFDGQKWSVEYGEYKDNLVFGTYKDEIWINSEYTHDLIRHISNTVTKFSYDPRSVTTSQSMFIDHSGHIWLIQRSGVVFEFDRTDWHYFYERDGVIDGLLKIAIEDKKGNIYIATEKGIATYNGEEWGVLITDEKFPEINGYRIDEIVFDQNGKIWIYDEEERYHETANGWMTFSKDYGNTFYNEKKLKWDSLIHRIDDSTFYTIAVSANGDEVLAKMHPNDQKCEISSYCLKFTGMDFQILKKGNASESISLPLLKYTGEINFKAVLLASDGSLWIGTPVGVLIYRDQRWTRLSKEDGLSGNKVYIIDQAPDGTIWFVTDGGISKYVEK